MSSAVRQENSSATAPQGPEPSARHFGLAEAPFKQTANPGFLFESASWRALLEDIAHAATPGESITVVTGASGTGKTTLCRVIAERCGPRTIVAIISNPPATENDLLRQVLAGFGFLTDDTPGVVRAKQYDLLRVLHQFLTSLVPLQARAILVFDEAQRLPPEVLDQIRVLLNLDPDHQQLQIILVGQPKLNDLLSRSERQNMKPHISRHRLRPLRPTEVTGYLDRRLSVAQVEQGTGQMPEFTASAIQAIAALSRGVPGVINRLCDSALENAWTGQIRMIDTASVVDAAKSANISIPLTVRMRMKRHHLPRVALAAAVLFGAVLLWTVSGSAILVRSPRSTAQSGVVQPTAAASAGSHAISMTPPAGAGPPEAHAASQDAVEAEPILIVVSSFRTRDRSAKVAANIAALGLPAFVRSTSEWFQVVVGPYVSKQEAAAVQDRLTRAHIGLGASEPDAGEPVVLPQPNVPVPEGQNPLLDDMLRRADMLARQPNVKAVQQIREQIVKRQQATAQMTNSSAFTSALSQVDRFLDEARHRQLEEDGRRLAAVP
jgi:type II secretory pathway predicted ATPase ExeA